MALLLVALALWLAPQWLRRRPAVLRADAFAWDAGDPAAFGDLQAMLDQRENATHTASPGTGSLRHPQSAAQQLEDQHKAATTGTQDPTGAAPAQQPQKGAEGGVSPARAARNQVQQLQDEASGRAAAEDAGQQPQQAQEPLQRGDSAGEHAQDTADVAAAATGGGLADEVAQSPMQQPHGQAGKIPKTKGTAAGAEVTSAGDGADVVLSQQLAQQSEDTHSQ